MDITKKTLWVVRDARRHSSLADIFFRVEGMEKLHNYMLGCETCAWEQETHRVYDDEEEARQDAFERLHNARTTSSPPPAIVPQLFSRKAFWR